MVTLISQFPNQFELHLRAILELPIPSIELAGPSASAVILADAGKRQLRVRRDRRGACARRSRQSGRPAHLRQADDAQEPADGHRARPRRQRRGRGRARQGCSCARPNSLFGLKEEHMRRIAIACCWPARCLAACGDSRSQQSGDQDQGPQRRTGTAQTARRDQPRDRAQARDLRRGLHLQAVTDAGFVGEWKNLDMWTAHCVYDKRHAARLGDFRRARRQRPGPRLQGYPGSRASRPASSRCGRRAASTKLK